MLECRSSNPSHQRPPRWLLGCTCRSSISTVQGGTNICRAFETSAGNGVQHGSTIAFWKMSGPNSHTDTAQGHSRAFIKGARTSMAMNLQDLAGLCPFVRESQVVRPNGHNSELGERIFNAGNHVDIIVETIAIATIPKRMQKLYIRLHLHSIVPRQTILPSIRHDKRCKGIQQPALSSGHYSKFSHTASKMHNEKQQGTVFIRFPRCLVFCSVSIRMFPFEMFPFDHLHLWHLLFHIVSETKGAASNEPVCGLSFTAMEGKGNKQTASLKALKPFWKGIECILQQHASKWSLLLW